MAIFGNISRRGLFRASAASAVAATAIGLASGCKHRGSEVSDPVVVDERAATNILAEDSAYAEVDLQLAETASWTLPVGTVLRPSAGTWIPGLAAGSSALPVVKAVALSSETGSLTDVVTSMVMGDEPNMAIYDVRCSDQVYAWVEIDMLKRDWVLYAQSFADGAVSGVVSTLWKGGADWDPPLFAVAGDAVIWQVMPAISGTKTRESSYCYLWHRGDSDAQAVVESPGRFAAPPSVSDGTVTLAPRVRADEGVFYGITAYDLRDDLTTIVDQLVLPQSVRPFRAVRMGNRFAFSVEANYSSGGLLGKMGTYIGTGDGPFITLVREPSAQVAGKDGLFIIKSRASYFVIDVDKETYSILSATNRCLDYGEYPVRDGICSTFTTFATVKDAQTGYPSAVAVRSFAL
ncbi:MAG: Tat pathway signal protein [Atopobiaceae bacterium]|nr:Tat pathway signal protein [Atopobiaceae bacterium]